MLMYFLPVLFPSCAVVCVRARARARFRKKHSLPACHVTSPVGKTDETPPWPLGPAV